MREILKAGQKVVVHLEGVVISHAEDGIVTLSIPNPEVKMAWWAAPITELVVPREAVFASVLEQVENER